MDDSSVLGRSGHNKRLCHLCESLADPDHSDVDPYFQFQGDPDITAVNSHLCGKSCRSGSF